MKNFSLYKTHKRLKSSVFRHTLITFLLFYMVLSKVSIDQWNHGGKVVGFGKVTWSITAFKFVSNYNLLILEFLYKFAHSWILRKLYTENWHQVPFSRSCNTQTWKEMKIYLHYIITYYFVSTAPTWRLVCQHFNRFIMIVTNCCLEVMITQTFKARAQLSWGSIFGRWYQYRVQDQSWSQLFLVLVLILVLNYVQSLRGFHFCSWSWSLHLWSGTIELYTKEN